MKKRKQGTPLQYLIGEVQFLGLRFRVRPGALIPRPETEEMVMRALRLLPRGRETYCLDLGTGSGVIGICLAKYLPRVVVTAVDISADALALAQENAALNGVTNRVNFLQSDWFEVVEGKYDLIVSNPPYVAAEEIPRLPAEVKDHEPEIALNGGNGGLEAIARIAEQVKDYLREDGVLLLEIGDGQGKRVFEMLSRAGLVGVRVERDLAERERFVIARCP